MCGAECIIDKNAVAQIGQFLGITFCSSIAILELGLFNPVTCILKQKNLAVL